jgi:hypothetical protein
MPMLAELVDGVIGVDTHRDTLAAAALTPSVGWGPRPPCAPMPAAIGSCWASPGRMSLAVGAGRWRAQAASAPAWPSSWPGAGSGCWRSAGQVAGPPHAGQQRCAGRNPRWP